MHTMPGHGIDYVHSTIISSWQEGKKNIGWGDSGTKKFGRPAAGFGKQISGEQIRPASGIRKMISGESFEVGL